MNVWFYIKKSKIKFKILKNIFFESLDISYFNYKSQCSVKHCDNLIIDRDRVSYNGCEGDSGLFLNWVFSGIFHKRR